MNGLAQPELQRQTLQLYGELLCRSERWGRKLAVAAFDGAASSGLSAAASLAGAASLVVDADAASMKAHFRDGAFDFVVNTLDEALRSVKNEVRLGRPIALGLIAEPVLVLVEAAERGLASDFILRVSGLSSVDPIASRDSSILESGGKASAELERWLFAQGWSSVELPFQSVAKAVETLGQDAFRGKWLRNLPAHQRSVRTCSSQWLWLSETERLHLSV